MGDKRELIVTNHAIVRYLERVVGVDIRPFRRDLKEEDYEIINRIENQAGFDLDEVRCNLIDKKTRLMIKHFGDGKYPIGGGFKAIVAGNKIVTIL